MCAAQGAAPACRAQQDEQGLGCGDPDVRGLQGGGASFMWGSPEREYVFGATNPFDPDQGYYKTTNGGRTVGAIYFSSSSGRPPSGTYTATGVAGQGGDYVRSSVPPP